MMKSDIFSRVVKEMLSVVILEQRPEWSEKEYRVDNLWKEFSGGGKNSGWKSVSACFLYFRCGTIDVPGIV